MKKYKLAIILFLFAIAGMTQPALISDDITAKYRLKIPFGISLPGNCKEGHLFNLTATTDSGLYVCRPWGWLRVGSNSMLNGQGISKVLAGFGLAVVNDSTIKVDTIAIVSKTGYNAHRDSVSTALSSKATMGGDNVETSMILGNNVGNLVLKSNGSGIAGLSKVGNVTTLSLLSQNANFVSTVYASRFGRTASYALRFKENSGDFDPSDYMSHVIGGATRLYVNPNTVTIGSNTSINNASLNLDETNKYFLPNRLTTVQRDLLVSPAQGAMIYNTTDSVYNYFDGSAWKSETMKYSTNTGNYFTVLAGNGGLGTGNFLLGNGAGNSTMSGNNNILIGKNSGHALTEASNVVAIGNLAAFRHTSNSYGTTTAIGNAALYNLTTGNANTAIGDNALRSITTTGANVATGYGSYYNLTGGFNIGTGVFTGFQSTSASSQVIIGHQAGSANKTGNDNAIIGFLAGSGTYGSSGSPFYPWTTSTTHNSNSVLGSMSMSNTSLSSNSVFIGSNAGRYDSSVSNLTIAGTSAGGRLKSSRNVIAIGADMLKAAKYSSEGASVYNDGHRFYQLSYATYIGGRVASTDTVANNVLSIGNGNNQDWFRVKQNNFQFKPYTISEQNIKSDVAYDFISTTGGLGFPEMSTSERLAISGVNQKIVFDTTLNKLCLYLPGIGWVALTTEVI